MVIRKLRRVMPLYMTLPLLVAALTTTLLFLSIDRSSGGNAAAYVGMKESLSFWRNAAAMATRTRTPSSNHDRRLYSADMTSEPEVDYLFPTVDVCNPGRTGLGIDLMVFVLTTHSHTEERMVIRSTWASHSNENTSTLRYIFLLGRTLNSGAIGKVYRESLKHQDILIGDFNDSYKNLTLKTILGLEYANKYCTSARFVMKTDDDVYLNVPALLAKIRAGGVPDNCIFGHLRNNTQPNRSNASKWFVSLEEYPRDHFPMYLDGLGYVFPQKLVRKVVETCGAVPFLFLEDVFIGLCLEKAGIEACRAAGFFRPGSALTPCSHRYENVMAVHGVHRDQFPTIWNASCPATGVLQFQEPRKAGRRVFKNTHLRVIRQLTA